MRTPFAPVRADLLLTLVFWLILASPAYCQLPPSSVAPASTFPVPFTPPPGWKEASPEMAARFQPPSATQVRSDAAPKRTFFLPGLGDEPLGILALTQQSGAHLDPQETAEYMDKQGQAEFDRSIARLREAGGQDAAMTIEGPARVDKEKHIVAVKITLRASGTEIKTTMRLIHGGDELVTLAIGYPAGQGLDAEMEKVADQAAASLRFPEGRRFEDYRGAYDSPDSVLGLLGIKARPHTTRNVALLVGLVIALVLALIVSLGSWARARRGRGGEFPFGPGYRFFAFAASFTLILMSIGVIAVLTFYVITMLVFNFTGSLRGAKEQNPQVMVYSLVPIVMVVAGTLAILFRRWKPTGARVMGNATDVLRPKIESVASVCGVPPPEELFLTTGANLSLFSSGLLRSGKYRSALSVGLPVLASLKDKELEALLAHEFGHLAMRRDAWECSLLNFTEAVSADLMRSYWRSAVALWPLAILVILGPFYGVFVLLNAPFRRHEELLADAFALSRYPHELGNALGKIIALDGVAGTGLPAPEGSAATGSLRLIDQVNAAFYRARVSNATNVDWFDCWHDACARNRDACHLSARQRWEGLLAERQTLASYYPLLTERLRQAGTQPIFVPCWSETADEALPFACGTARQALSDAVWANDRATFYSAACKVFGIMPWVKDVTAWGSAEAINLRTPDGSGICVDAQGMSLFGTARGKQPSGDEPCLIPWTEVQGISAPSPGGTSTMSQNVAGAFAEGAVIPPYLTLSLHHSRFRKRIVPLAFLGADGAEALAAIRCFATASAQKISVNA